MKERYYALWMKLKTRKEVQRHVDLQFKRFNMISGAARLSRWENKAGQRPVLHKVYLYLTRHMSVGGQIFHAKPHYRQTLLIPQRKEHPDSAEGTNTSNRNMNRCIIITIEEV